MNRVDRTESALKRGVDELQSRLEFVLEGRPRALKLSRERYVKFARLLYRAIERANS